MRFTLGHHTKFLLMELELSDLILSPSIKDIHTLVYHMIGVVTCFGVKVETDWQIILSEIEAESITGRTLFCFAITLKGEFV